MGSRGPVPNKPLTMLENGMLLDIERYDDLDSRYSLACDATACDAMQAASDSARAMRTTKLGCTTSIRRWPEHSAIRTPSKSVNKGLKSRASR